MSDATYDYVPVETQSESRQNSAASILTAEGNTEEEGADLLIELHKSLQRINEGMMRSNTALSELVDEVRLLRKSQ